MGDRLKEDGKKKRLYRKHEQVKIEIGTFAQEHGFRIVYEEETEDGGRVDIGLHNKEISIACEVSVTNTSDYEVKNIQKCLKAGYHLVCVITQNTKHQDDIQKKANNVLSKKEQSKVRYLSLLELKDCIVENKVKPKPQEKIIKGYRVKVRYSDTDNHKAQEAKEKIAKTMLDSLNKRKKK